MKTIYIVDDNLDIITSLKTGLEDESEQYHVVGSTGGQECLDLLKKSHPPDIILLDIMMPGMSGWELYDTLKEHSVWKNIPIIFLTARTDRIARNTGRFLGDDYIEKPFEIADITARINTVLSSKKSTFEGVISI